MPQTVAPHAPIPGYYNSLEHKRGVVRRMFDQAAGDYDRIERLMALGSGSWYRRGALVRCGLAPGMRVLDVATGTGLVAREAAGVVGEASTVIGVDPSAGMLAQAARSMLPPNVRLTQGAAESLPVAGESVDFVSMGYALRHVSDLSAAFGEFFRVLRPGGRVCVLEITRPGGRAKLAMLRAYMHWVVPALARLGGNRGGDSRTLWSYYW